MILSFGNDTTSDIFHGENTKAARRIPMEAWKAAYRKLDMLNAAREVRDLSSPPGNRLESLRGNLRGFHSVRINDQFRLVFRFEAGNAQDVRILDYH